MANLRIQTGPKKGALVPIQETSFTLGRGEKVELQVPDHGASRRHAEIFRIGELHFIRDLASRNGTFVNDRRVAEVVLREGDQIRVGDTFMVFLETENYPISRAIHLHNGSGVMESVRCRDTMSSPQASTDPLEEKGLLDEKRPAGSLPRRVAQILASGRSLKLLFQEVVRESGAALGGDRADLLFIEAGEPDLEFRAIATYDTKGDGEVAVSRSILNEVIQTKQAILLADASTDLRIGDAEHIVQHSIRSVLAVPLLVDQEAVGLLYICHSQQSDAFDRGDLEIAAQVGLQLGAVFAMLRRAREREDILSGALQIATEEGTARRVAEFCRAIAVSLGLEPAEIHRAWAAGLLHQIEALRKGKSGLRPLPPGMEKVLAAIAGQEALHDGTGSPAGQQGETIPILGRILALAKKLDAVLSQPGVKDLTQALEAIRRLPGAEFHPDIVQACLLAQRNGLLDRDPERSLPLIW